jgi:hypothetical protein
MPFFGFPKIPNNEREKLERINAQSQFPGFFL